MIHKAKKQKQKHNTICVGHHYTPTSTDNVNKHQRVPKRQSKMDSPEKLATYGTQDEDDQTKNTIEAVAVAWQLDLQLPVQSGPITNKFVSSNPADGEMYSIQYFELKLVENL